MERHSFLLADGGTSRPAPAGVVIPVRTFLAGKSRLAGILGPASRAELMRRMAERVVEAAGPNPVAVVSSAPEVVEWALALGLDVIPDPGSLDAAAAAGVSWAARAGLPRAVIAHADLPLARSLTALARDGGRPVVAAVPCHRDDGTPVLSVPTDADFAFAYGEGSFRRHAAEARRRGLAFRALRDGALAFDVDAPEDLDGLSFPRRAAGPAMACSRV